MLTSLMSRIVTTADVTLSSWFDHLLTCSCLHARGHEQTIKPLSVRSEPPTTKSGGKHMVTSTLREQRRTPVRETL